ncbi:MAG TPA: NDP-sugar synthase [Thermoleophilia bacterium]|nr:NDP-sugar synthase [Thermoleophilia bacterium]HQG03073.1 NDP-sugar synthase [Thermoleophilia bacterium]HQJ97495.1 NDP-sugar synthase [Thermoleophilia bacterium]
MSAGGVRFGSGASAPVKAMVMAAGLGTRLYPLTGRTAKPMVPILNRPVMEHMLRLLRRHGVREVAANLHYHPDKIRSYFGDGSAFGVELRYNLEKELLGTAGGVAAFREFLGDSTFVVVSGDGLTDIDLTAFVAAHRRNGGVCTMAVKRVADPSLYGVVVHDEGRVVGFQEKVPAEEARSDLCNCGIYAFEPEIFDFVPQGGPVDWARDVFPALLAAGAPFHVWPLETYWNDVGNIEQYRVSNFDALLGRVALQIPGREVASGVWVGEGTQIEPGARLKGPLLLGAGCLVEAEAELIGPLIIGDGCVIERGAVLEGVIQWDGVKNGRGSRLAGSILGRHVTVHHEAVVHEDAVIGDRADIAAHALVPPGARCEPRSRVGVDGPRGVDGRRGVDDPRGVVGDD